jgi:hypothetical protein
VLEVAVEDVIPAPFGEANDRNKYDQDPQNQRRKPKIHDTLLAAIAATRDLLNPDRPDNTEGRTLSRSMLKNYTPIVYHYKRYLSIYRFLGKKTVGTGRMSQYRPVLFFPLARSFLLAIFVAATHMPLRDGIVDDPVVDSILSTPRGAALPLIILLPCDIRHDATDRTIECDHCRHVRCS